MDWGNWSARRPEGWSLRAPDTREVAMHGLSERSANLCPKPRRDHGCRRYSAWTARSAGELRVATAIDKAHCCFADPVRSGTGGQKVQVPTPATLQLVTMAPCFPRKRASSSTNPSIDAFRSGQRRARLLQCVLTLHEVDKGGARLQTQKCMVELHHPRRPVNTSLIRATASLWSSCDRCAYVERVSEICE